MTLRAAERARALLGSARHVLRRDLQLVRLARGFEGLSALEPGGPSALLEGWQLVPVYPRLSKLAVLDYAETTLWTDAGAAMRRRPAGLQVDRVIGEAGTLAEIPSGSYEAVLASHVIEHLANPVGALREWQRIVGRQGRVLLIVPHMEGTFDHRRPLTTIEHMLGDAEREMGEQDMTHLEEVLALHDMSRNPGSPDRETFERRCRENEVTRSLHHHTFTTRSVFELCRAAGLRVVALRPKLPHDIVCLCRDEGGRELGPEELSRVLRRSPFARDREAA